jgi:hypothetical protein
LGVLVAVAMGSFSFLYFAHPTPIPKNIFCTLLLPRGKQSSEGKQQQQGFFSCFCSLPWTL